MDAALIWDQVKADIALSGGDLLADNGLATAVIISLCSDARAEFSDELPAGVTERRGWWGGDKDFGSKLWLLTREKTTARTAARAREYVQKALQWLIDDGIAQSVEVTAEILNPYTLAVSASISRGSNKKYDYLWRSMASTDQSTYVASLKIPLNG